MKLQEIFHHQRIKFVVAAIKNLLLDLQRWIEVVTTVIFALVVVLLVSILRSWRFSDCDERARWIFCLKSQKFRKSKIVGLFKEVKSISWQSIISRQSELIEWKCWKIYLCWTRHHFHFFDDSQLFLTLHVNQLFKIHKTRLLFCLHCFNSRFNFNFPKKMSSRASEKKLVKFSVKMRLCVTFQFRKTLAKVII